MYHVSVQGVDERMINVHYYYYYYLFFNKSRADHGYTTHGAVFGVGLTVGIVVGVLVVTVAVVVAVVMVVLRMKNANADSNTGVCFAVFPSGHDASSAGCTV